MEQRHITKLPENDSEHGHREETYGIRQHQLCCQGNLDTT